MTGSAWFALSLWATGTCLVYLVLQQLEQKTAPNGRNLCEAALWPLTLFFLRPKMRRWVAARSGRKQ